MAAEEDSFILMSSQRPLDLDFDLGANDLNSVAGESDLVDTPDFNETQEELQPVQEEETQQRGSPSPSANSQDLSGFTQELVESVPAVLLLDAPEDEHLGPALTQECSAGFAGAEDSAEDAAAALEDNAAAALEDDAAAALEDDAAAALENDAAAALEDDAAEGAETGTQEQIDVGMPALKRRRCEADADPQPIDCAKNAADSALEGWLSQLPTPTIDHKRWLPGYYPQPTKPVAGV